MSAFKNPKYTGIIGSLLLHAVVIAAFILATTMRSDSDGMLGRGGNYQVDMMGGGVGDANNQITPPKDEQQLKDADANTGLPTTQTEQTGDGGGLLAGIDTSGLPGQYVEETLHVRIRYPVGWSFMDQNKKNKLDGVTFLGTPTSTGVIPYIHIDVQEKFMFNPDRYKRKSEEKNYTMYYNDPELLEGQYTQTIYIHTETDEDYAIKLIVKGESDFREFQPVFFAMIKTFKYGNY